MRKRSALLATIAAIAALACALALAGCGNKSVDVIKVGGGLPNIPAADLGLGDLYEAKAPSENCQKFDGKGNGKAFYVFREGNEDGLSLEEYTKRCAQRDGAFSYRVDISETYSYSDQQIEDGFYTYLYSGDNAPKGMDGYFAQVAIFQDGDEFVRMVWGYGCNEIAIEGTDLALYVPIVSDADKYEFSDDTEGTLYSYEKITEIPAITVGAQEKKGRYESIDTFLSTLCSGKKLVFAIRSSINGLECGIRHVEQEIDGLPHSTYRYVFDCGDSLATVGFREHLDDPTYAIEALASGIHKVEQR